MKKRILSSILVLVMILSMLPATAFAAVTAENDWDIFDANDTYNLPKTQEQIFMAMIQNETFAKQWATIANSILPKTFYNEENQDSYNESYKSFTSTDYENPKYTANGLRAAVSEVIQENAILSGSGVLNSLPEGNFPVYYVSTRANYNRLSSDRWYEGRGYGYYIQLFYDFEIEGIEDRFTSPEVADDDTLETLEKKGYNFSLGGSSDSYQVTAENRNDFENTVEKSYSYEKSTTTSTTVSNTYSQSWSEETTIAVEFNVPLFATLSPSAHVEQKFIYSYGMDKTYETSKEESYSQSIQDTISVPLPAHTGIDINVDVTDSTTTIPYSGAVRIKYKTIILSVTGYDYHQLIGSDLSHWQGQQYTKYTFGRDGRSAVEDLDARIQNRNVLGYDPDNLDLASLYDGNFKTAADALCSGQPVAPYFGDFHYTSKNTVITPHQVYPLYALDRLVPDTESVELYEQQDMRLDGIKIEALDAYDVDWYGFNARLSGAWTVVDENLDDASEYAQITTNRNGYPVLKALKPNDGKELFLRYQPNSSIKTTVDFNSELIELTIYPVQLSSVTLAGSFDDFYLDDSDNKTDVSALTVTAKDADGKDFDVTGKVKWYAEAADGITVNEATGAIEFTEPGTYQIYAVVNGTESNRVQLQVLPARYLDTLSVTGTIPDLIYNDDTANTFDLSTLTVEAKDQYGQDMTLDTEKYEWKLASDKGYAEISGNTITGLVVGTDTVTLYYPAGQDEQGETVYKTAQPVTVNVTAKPYLNELYYNGGAPAAVEGVAYDLTQIPLLARDQHGNSYAVPTDIVWSLADNNQTAAMIDNNMLTVSEGSVPEASYAEVILEASSESTGKVAKNVVVKAEQKPVLKTIQSTMKDDFVLRLDENAVLADQFTAVGCDQYGRVMDGVNFEWYTSNPDVVSLENGKLTALKEDSTEIYAKSGDIESNHITLTVNAPRRLTSITADGIKSTARVNTTLDLSTVAVKTYDQFQKEFTGEELAAYPASIRWTLEKNDTNAVINGNILSFGDQEGTMTLICAAVNTDTNVIAEKKINISITNTSYSGGGGGGGVISSYDITIADTENGSVTASAKTAAKGDTVTLTVDPDKGYALETLTALDKNGKEIKLTDNGSGKYTFTMPAGNVTVETSFKTDSVEPVNPFTDVTSGAYYEDAVIWAVSKGITSGTTETTFSPDASCTRAQAVTFLWRAAGCPAPQRSEMTFTDVAADAYYYDAVLWAVENGITKGTGDTTFSPNATCSRAQIVAFLWRSENMPAAGTVNSFTDVAADAYYADAVNWAVESGITSGTTDTTFSPDADCTRAQIVTFLYRCLGEE
ncbi:MAG: S-layer homology domain-containing protein [Firmicutes bacterium]|nr:S-layer homology domain-containing protein [Bacillota bacterium]